MAEITSSAEPVKAMLLDLGATTDLDVPSADMLTELGEELHSRNVRFMLMRMIMPVRHMLEAAGAMQMIRPEDVFIGPTEAVLDYLTSQYDEAEIQELMRSGADSLRGLLQASLATAPAERQAALASIAEGIGKGIKPSEL
jgi:MFS superfamily sulfate permease-like transporter